MNHCGSRCKQKGAVLWMLLIAIIMAGSFAFYRTSNVQFNRIQHESKLATNMALAKEALIARAVMDDNRPGSLPCPDLITDSDAWSNKPGDGNSDKFIGAANGTCPSYVGWLPWVTLDLPELVDETGTRFWYVLSKKLTDDESASPINSDTEMQLSVDGNNEIAALIIAPRSPLNGQGNRPSHTPSDYLDGENGNADDQKYITGPQSDSFNDLVLTITRQELMAAVEKRVANEVRSCLEQHAKAMPTYPWPAPMANLNFHGNAGSLFGRIPNTQPSPSQEKAITDNAPKINEIQSKIGKATGVSEQIDAIKGANQDIAKFDAQIYNPWGFSISPFSLQSANTLSALSKLGEDITSAISNGRISATELKTLRSNSAQINLDLKSFAILLADTGLDPYPLYLAAIRSELASLLQPSGTQKSSQPVIENLLQVLGISQTPNPEITRSISATAQLAITALNSIALAENTPNDSYAIEGARVAVTCLINNIADVPKDAIPPTPLSPICADHGVLKSTVLSQRVNIQESEVRIATNTLRNIIGTSNPQLSRLREHLTNMQNTVNKIDTASSLVNLAKNNANALIANAFNFIKANDTLPQPESLQQLLSASESLALAIKNNGENITLESLKPLSNAFAVAENAFTTATPKTQALMVPYVSDLTTPAVNLVILLKIIDWQAQQIASWHTTAQSILSSINKVSKFKDKTGSLDALSEYKKNNSDENLQNAIRAINETIAALAKLQSAIESFSQTSADAAPLIWSNEKCAALHESNSDMWWTKNKWRDLIFYQIGDRYIASEARLTIIGKPDKYKTVALAAGAPVWQQQDKTNTCSDWLLQNRKTTPNNLTKLYLDDINADTTRDGLALTPVEIFVDGSLQKKPAEYFKNITKNCLPLPNTPGNALMATTFNDRLSYRTSKPSSP